MLLPRTLPAERLGCARTRRASHARIGLALCAVSFLSILGVASAQATAQDGRWSQPYRLSSDAGKASEGYCVADPYGFVNCFWTETLFADNQWVIQYARFDGETWSASNEIYATGVGIASVSPVADRQGTLHVAWAEGLNGPAYYTRAPAPNALSSRSWSQPRRIDIPAGIIRLRVDSKGTLHVVYINRGEELGVYYVRSEDQGRTWTGPVWLDPDIPPDHTPQSLNFEVDEVDGLHAVWKYGALVPDAPNRDWVRYSHSLDGGATWSSPFTIDRYLEGSDHRLGFAEPRMIVQGQAVHVVWAAGEQPYRHHRFSTDAGRTWGPARRIFGDLHGQAFEGLAVDRAGRVHFLGQIRYPMGIYHAVWDQDHWTLPSLVYLIADEGSEDGIGDRIHAHHVQPVVRAGNQLVLTFADGPADPNRRLFVMHRTLDDLAPLAPLPTPTPSKTSLPLPSPTSALPTSMPTATTSETAGQPPGQVPEPDSALRAALIPSLLLLGATLVFRVLQGRKP